MAKKLRAVKAMGKHTWSETKVGCVLLEEGKAKPFEPSEKPLLIPLWDKEMCVRCGICYLFCPDAAIKRGDDGFYEANLDYCKGCGICSFECPTDPKSIEMKLETDVAEKDASATL